MRYHVWLINGVIIFLVVMGVAACHNYTPSSVFNITDLETEDMITVSETQNGINETALNEDELIPEYEITQTLYQELRASDGVLLARNEFNQPVFHGSSFKVNQMNEVFKEELNGVDLSDFDWTVEAYDSHEGYTYMEAQEGRVAGNLVNWEESYRNHQYLSFIGVYEWDGLGVHGSYDISGHTFHVLTGEEMSLADIMRIPADELRETMYQEYISYHTALDDGYGIMAQGHEESLDDGTVNQYYIDSVKAQCGENAVFWLDDDGVHIFFYQYTFYYAAGLSELIIPYTRDDLLKAEFVISSSESPGGELTNRNSTDDYILPESDLRIYTSDELRVLTPEELRLARNEIYARHGRIFSADDLNCYFLGKSWYTPRYEAAEIDALGDGLFNEFELANRDLIVDMEKQKAKVNQNSTRESVNEELKKYDIQDIALFLTDNTRLVENDGFYELTDCYIFNFGYSNSELYGQKETGLNVFFTKDVLILNKQNHGDVYITLEKVMEIYIDCMQDIQMDEQGYITGTMFDSRSG